MMHKDENDCGSMIMSTALKIQCSGATADLLHILSGYILTCRGSLSVKVILKMCVHVC